MELLYKKLNSGRVKKIVRCVCVIIVSSIPAAVSGSIESTGLTESSGSKQPIASSEYTPILTHRQSSEPNVNTAPTDTRITNISSEKSKKSEENAVPTSAVIGFVLTSLLFLSGIGCMVYHSVRKDKSEVKIFSPPQSVPKVTNNGTPDSVRLSAIEEDADNGITNTESALTESSRSTQPTPTSAPTGSAATTKSNKNSSKSDGEAKLPIGIVLGIVLLSLMLVLLIGCVAYNKLRANKNSVEELPSPQNNTAPKITKTVASDTACAIKEEPENRSN